MEEAKSPLPIKLDLGVVRVRQVASKPPKKVKKRKKQCWAVLTFL
jgi:hypothetical protein